MKSNYKRKDIQSRNQASIQTKNIGSVLGIISLLTGCTQMGQANAQDEPSPTPTETVSATSTTTATVLPTPTATSSPTLFPSPTAWPTLTPWPTATPWSRPVAWTPVQFVPSTLAPVPVTSLPVMVGETVPINYAPPNGVDVFGAVMLHWDYFGALAEDEFFDIKLKPFGSQNSAFVDWAKSPEYELRPWSGWTPGLYTWQIGIIKGYLEGDTKHFMTDTGRDSQPFLLKWQVVGDNGGGSGGGSQGGGNNSSGGS